MNDCHCSPNSTQNIVDECEHYHMYILGEVAIKAQM